MKHFTILLISSISCAQSFLLVPYVLRKMLPIQTEPNINVGSYLGLWSQVATSRSSALLGTGVRYTNVSAYYDLLNNSNIGVYNSGYDENNNFTSIHGYSYNDGDSQTKRKLHFDGVPVDGNYWIVKLGPIHESLYRYAIVSGALTSYFGTRFSLYVLARNREEYQTKYEKEVKQWCEDNNFVFFWNKYVPTN